MIGDSDKGPADGGLATISVYAAVVSSLGLISSLDPFREDVVARFEALHAHCSAHQCSLNDAADALGQAIDPPLIALYLSTLAREWLDGGAQQVIHVKDYLLYRDWEEGTEDERLVFTIASMLEPLAQLELKHGFEVPTLVRDSIEAASDAAAMAEARGHRKAALDALDAASLLARQAGLPDELKLAADALRVARAIGDPDRVALQSLRHAFALHAAAARDGNSWMPALEAFEGVLRNLPTGADAKRLCLGGIIAAARLPGMRPLWPWVAMLVAEAPPDLASVVQGLDAYVPLVVDGSLEAFLSRVQDLAKVAQMAEDERVALQGPPEDHKARADWATWSMRHAAFRSAIPHGNSFLRERDRDQLILVLNHELTHMVSMTSGVGLAIMALRAALTELEVDLWVRHAGDQLDVAVAGVRRGLAPVADDDLRALALVERELEIALKLRVLQDCWAPWFEGLAIAEELSDPRDDPDAHTPSLQALMQLVDAPVRPEPVDNEATFGAKVSAYFSQFEDLYSEAVRAQGPARLQSYLRPPHAANYLAGYLTVRSIVAAWRHTLAKLLAGKAATRILMHVTRYGTGDAVPDLALPLDEFRRQAVRRHVEWVEWVASLRADQIQATLDLIGTAGSSSRGAAWRNGELATSTEDNAALTKKVDAQVLELATQAYGSLTGTNAPADRVAGANEDCLAVLKRVGELLASEHPNPSLVSSLSHHYLSLLRVVPLGEVDAPFWLLPQAKALYVLIRTTEKHDEHGEPAYNAMLLGEMEGADFDRLHDEVRRLRGARMTVTRYTDLMPGGVMEGRGFGRNVLVFQYGSWRYMLPSGLLLGGASAVESTLRSDIDNRLPSSPLAELDMRELADGTKAAHRARAWLDTVDQWTVGGQRLALEPWAARVRALADEIEHPNGPSDRETVGVALLRFVLGPDAPADAALAGGLSALCCDDDGTVAGACRLLFASGRNPVPQADAAEMHHWGSLFQINASQVDVAPPFRQPARGG
jgi:hypothetical protein